MKKLLFLFLLLFLLSGCGQTPPAETTLSTAVPTTATAPTAEPTEPSVPFPEAPENSGLQSLPQILSVETLVEDYWTRQLRFPDGSVCYAALPRILPFSQEAIACQEEIYQLFARELQPLPKDGTESLPWDGDLSGADLTRIPVSDRARYFTYSAGYQNGVLSILLRLDTQEESAAPYRVYNLTVPEAVDTAIQPELTRMELYLTVENDYRSQFSPRVSPPEQYHEALMNTLGENLELCQSFYNASSGISVLTHIYRPGLSQPEQRIIPFTPLNCEYQPRREISGSYAQTPGSFFIDQGSLFEHDHSHAVTETVHSGPVKLAIRSRDHWFYTLEDTPGTLMRKDRNTKEEFLLISGESGIITDMGFYGYEDDGWLVVVYDSSRILVYRVPEFACVTYHHHGIHQIESYKSHNKTLVYWDANQKLWELKLDTGEVTKLT